MIMFFGHIVLFVLCIMSDVIILLLLLTSNDTILKTAPNFSVFDNYESVESSGVWVLEATITPNLETNAITICHSSNQ